MRRGEGLRHMVARCNEFAWHQVACKVVTDELILLSPLRYPGGKTWLREAVLRWLRSLPQRRELFIEPFAGGASVGLAVANAQVVERVILAELDPEVATLWKVIFGGAWRKLTDRIDSFIVLRADVRHLLASQSSDIIETAFRCLLRNRLQHGGVMAPGANLLKNGEGNRGLASRWYPATLIDRITKLQSLRPVVEVIEGNGLDLLTRFADDATAVFFVDPPYQANGIGPGRRLYRYADIDHKAVFSHLADVRGDFLLCYHDCSDIRELVRSHGFRFRSVAMRTTHHENRRELIISKSNLRAIH